MERLSQEKQDQREKTELTEIQGRVGGGGAECPQESENKFSLDKDPGGISNPGSRKLSSHSKQRTRKNSPAQGVRK